MGQTAVPVGVSLAHHTCDSWPSLYLKFAEDVEVLWACGKQNVLQTFSGKGIVWVMLFLEIPSMSELRSAPCKEDPLGFV